MRNAIVLISCMSLVLFPARGASQDLEIDFEFLKVGQTRKAVVDKLGEPSSQSRSSSFHIEYRKLTWVGSDGWRYTTSFIQNRLWRWKKCSPSSADC